MWFNWFIALQMLMGPEKLGTLIFGGGLPPVLPYMKPDYRL